MAKKEYELLEFTIPNWALSSLINGDDSGLEEEDIEKLDKFVKETVAEYGNANFMLPRDEEMDLGFKRWNDIDNLGNDCSLLYLRPSKEYDEGGETDDDDMEEDENEQRLQELADEYDIPTEVIEEYANDRGIEISEITDLPYNGRYDSEEAYAEQMVDDGVITDLSYYLYMYPTDMRLLAQEEADRRVDDMDDDDLLSEADMEDEANEYSENQDEIDELRDEIRDLQTEIDDLFEDEDEDTTEGELQGKEEKAKELREELEDKENELERLEDRLASLDNYAEVVDKAREQLREEYYDEIYDALEKDAVGYFVDELGYNVEDLANNSGFSVDYEKLASELGYDVNYIHHEGEVYVFSNYERGGMTYAEGGSIPNNYEGLIEEEVWDSWNVFQKAHFLSDHHDKFKNISWKNEDIADTPVTYRDVARFYYYIDLPYQVKSALREHILEGQYAKGGFVEHGLEIGDKIISHKLKDDTIIVENNFRHEKARVDLEKGKRTLIERDKNKYAHGGEIKWQDVEVGDSANVKSENKTGVIVKTYGRKFHLKFVDGSEKTYDASDLEFFKDEDDYAKGGGIPKSYTHFIVRKSDNKIINGYDYKGVDADDIKYYTKEDFKDMEISSKDFTLLTKKSLESKGINPYDESNWTNSYAEGGMMAKGGETEKDIFRYRNKLVSMNVGKDLPALDFAIKVIDMLIDDELVVGKVEVKKDDSYKSILKYRNKLVSMNVGKDLPALDFAIKVIDMLIDGELSFPKEMADGGKIGDRVKVSDFTDYAYYNTLEQAKEYADNLRARGYEAIVTESNSGYQAQHRVLYRKRIIDFRNEKRVYGSGGVTFDDKVDSISKALLKRKKVSPSVQKDYGKTYSKKEAIESAKRIAGAMRKKEKMAKGGVVEKIKDKIEIANKLISDGKTMKDIDEGKEVKYMPLKLKGNNNDLIIEIKVKENGRWVNEHKYKVTEWDEGYGEESRLEALNRIIKELKTNKVELFAKGGDTHEQQGGIDIVDFDKDGDMMVDNA